MKKIVAVFLALIISASFVNAEEVVVLDGESGMTETKKSDELIGENPDGLKKSDGTLKLNEESMLGTNKAASEIKTIVVPPTSSLPESSAPSQKSEEVKNDDFKTAESSKKDEENLAKEVFPNVSSPVRLNSLANHPYHDGYLPYSFVHVYTGRLITDLKKVSSTLSKEIDLFGFGVAKMINDHWQGIMSLEIGQKKNEKNTSKNIVIYQMKVGGEYERSFVQGNSIKYLLHSAITIGDFSLRSVSAESQQTVSYNKFGEGTLIGLHPGLGLRFPISNVFNLDGLVIRPFYLGNERKKLGGFQYLARFALPW